MSYPTISGYTIERELGQGGMAKVYLAHEDKLDRQVALKVLTLLSEEGRPLAERFVKEAKTAARLHHSNIITIHDVGRAENCYYMAVEYLPGGTLRERMLNGPMEPAEALKVIGQMATALGYAHEQGFVHRDIKPENIMFRRDGMAVLTDFGIAKAVGSTTKMTKTGMSIGTPHYMSPEQARGKTLDGCSDLYSLGIVFHEMLTGRVPYEAEDSIAIAVKHIQEPIPELPGHLSPYQPLLEKLLAKDPSDRFQTGAELVSALEREVEGQRSEGQRSGSDSPGYGSRVTDHVSSPRPTPPPKPKTGPRTRMVDPDESSYDGSHSKRKSLVIGLVLALVVLIAILAVVLGGGRDAPKSVVNEDTPSLTRSGGTPQPAEDPQVRQKAAYDGHMAAARRALSSSDLDTAAREIDRAKAIRSGNEVALLEQNLKASIEKKQQAEREETARKQMDRLREEQRRIEESRLAEDRRQAEVEKQRQEAAEAEKANREEAARLAAAEEKARAVNIEMVRIPGGTFQMGSNSSKADFEEKIVHNVTLSTFYISKTEVTQGQWQTVMGSNPSYFLKGDNYPVERVSWDDCQEFIRKLKQITGKRYRLPTEAEWEYAARGGTSGDRYGDLNSIAWYGGNSGDSTYPVAQKQANSYGLYDMLGNVWEWCEDWYGDYSANPQDNPTGPSSGSVHIRRGGSWNGTAGFCRASIRSGGSPDDHSSTLGFRLAADGR